MKLLSLLNKISWVTLLLGAAGRMFFRVEGSYVFLASALLLAVTQFFLRERGGNFVVRRLVKQQQIGAVALVAAGLLMFTHTRNEWIVAMFVGALFELYTAYRIPQELKK